MHRAFLVFIDSYILDLGLFRWGMRWGSVIDTDLYFSLSTNDWVDEFFKTINITKKNDESTARFDETISFLFIPSHSFLSTFLRSSHSFLPSFFPPLLSFLPPSSPLSLIPSFPPSFSSFFARLRLRLFLNSQFFDPSCFSYTIIDCRCFSSHSHPLFPHLPRLPSP